MMERIYTYEDLIDSGPVIMALFKYTYPDGLTLAEMLASPEGWVQRAAMRLLEIQQDGEML